MGRSGQAGPTELSSCLVSRLLLLVLLASSSLGQLDWFIGEEEQSSPAPLLTLEVEVQEEELPTHPELPNGDLDGGFSGGAAEEQVDGFPPSSGVQGDLVEVSTLLPEFQFFDPATIIETEVSLIKLNLTIFAELGGAF